MSLIYADRVKESTATTGTGTVTLAGAVSGYQSFAQVGNGNNCYYRLESGTDWEIGIGTYTSSGTTLSRDAVLASSNSGSKITLAGTSYAFLDIPATFYSLGTFIIKARVASTANVTLATAVDNGKTLNGVTLATGDVIFLPFQSSASENGAYIVAASGAPSRHPLMPAGMRADGLFVQVTAGTLYKDQLFVCTSNTTVVGTDATTWGPPVNNMIGDSGSGGTRGLVPAPSSGDAAALKFLKADGSWAVPGGSAVAGSISTNFLHNVGFTMGQRDDFTSYVQRNDNTYGLDRWKILSQGSYLQVQQVAGTNAKYGMSLKNNIGVSLRMGAIQVLESADSVPLRGRTVTLKTGIKAEETKDFYLFCLEWTGTADSPTTDVVNDWTDTTFTTGHFFISSNLTVTGSQLISATANTLTSGTLTVTVGNSCNNLMFLVVSKDTIGTTKAFTIETPQLVDGATAGAWIPRTPEQEEAICWRYCFGISGSRFSGIAYDTSNIISIYNRFPVPMRVQPTMSVVGSPTWGTSSPTSSQVATFKNGSGSGSYVTISGSVTVNVYSYDRWTFLPWFVAGTNFGGGSLAGGTDGQMLFGSAVRIVADADF